MSKEKLTSREKPIMSIRIDPDLLARVDKLCERVGVGRGEIIERLISVGLVDEEEFVAWLEHPIKGQVIHLLSHPKVLPVLIKLLGGEADETQFKIRRNVANKARKRGTQGKLAQG